MQFNEHYVKGVLLPLIKRWSAFSEEKIQNECYTYGCYELGNSKCNIVYIGQGRVKDRLVIHWKDTRGKPRVSYYRWHLLRNQI